MVSLVPLSSLFLCSSFLTLPSVDVAEGKVCLGVTRTMHFLDSSFFEPLKRTVAGIFFYRPTHLISFSLM